MINPDEIAFAVFDCDGVIFDSNPIKIDAFRYALEGFAEKTINDLVEYHRNHGGISRYEKFRYFFNTLVGDDDEEKYRAALHRFGTYCATHFLEASLVPGVGDFLQTLDAQNVPMFVVSGSDQSELRSVLNHRKLLPFFKQVLGSPVSKRDNLKALLDGIDIHGSGVFFGDAHLDYQIASENGLDFVFVFDYSDWAEGKSFCAQQKIVCIRDFHDLPGSVCGSMPTLNQGRK